MHIHPVSSSPIKSFISLSLLHMNPIDPIQSFTLFCKSKNILVKFAALNVFPVEIKKKKQFALYEIEHPIACIAAINVKTKYKLKMSWSSDIEKR